MSARNNSCVPIKDKNRKLLMDAEEQNAQSLEHLKETLNQPTHTETFDFCTFICTGSLKAKMDAIMEVEVMNTIKALKNDNVIGPEQIKIELLKCREISTTTALTRLLNVCWQEEYIPEEWRWGVIVKLPKSNISSCNNWHSVMLLSVPSKVFCTILLRWLCEVTDASLHKE